MEGWGLGSLGGGGVKWAAIGGIVGVKRPTHALKEYHRCPCPSLPCSSSSRRSAPAMASTGSVNRSAPCSRDCRARTRRRLGAGRYERSEDRLTERNGTGPNALAAKAGDGRLRIPKLRKGSYFPSILEPYRRIDQALCAVVGLRPRLLDPRVDDLVFALGADCGMSKCEVSRISEQLDEVVGALRNLTHGLHRVPLCLPRRDPPPRP